MEPVSQGLDLNNITLVVLIIFFLIGGAAIFYTIVKPLLFPPDSD